MKVYLANDSAELPAGLVCPECDWRPPTGWHRRRKGLYGKNTTPLTFWRARYREHREDRLCPQYRAEANQRYIRGMERTIALAPYS